MSTYEITVDGIPALAEITSGFKQEPQGIWADSDHDCFGYVELEYDIKDRNGYPLEGDAEWLYKKAEAKDLFDEIYEQILTQIG